MLKRIPPPFIKNLDGNISQTISLTNMAGRVWPAKLGFHDNTLHITAGWPQYVQYHKLECGDFVVVRYLQNSTFQVMAFGTNGCIKDEPMETIQMEGVAGTYSAGAPAPGPGRSIRFQKIFRTNFKNFVSIPKQVLQACTFTLDQNIRLSNTEGVGITTQLRVTSDRIVLGYSGLTKLWHMIGVQKGDKLEFEVICENGNMIKEIIVNNISQSRELGRAY
ncbi:hypothetical protein RND81_02G163800 [Saponaria officinalis]|uniref:TF-B3 domain-containing protein n=1 Tax=Saponaria officinalis TaxID=3572 RepID=A0AAW1MMM3_SAPOF